jgi:hypothetical protein
MVRVVLASIAVAACGGSPPPKPQPKPEPPPPVAKRVPIEDSEPEDGVTIVNAKGYMEKDKVQAGIAPHNDELNDCYAKKVGRRRWLGGHVLIHWDIKKDGTITSIKLMAESNLGAWAIEKCLLDVARSAEFDKPVGGDADFSLPLEFSEQGSALPWSEEQALKAVGKQLAKLEACDKKDRAHHGVTITMYVGPHGKAQSVGFSSDKLEISDKWADCAEKVAMAWRLPDPRGTIAKLAVHRP